jgi:hypothetical protein
LRRAALAAAAIAAAAIAAFAFWPTRARRLSRATDALLEAVERGDRAALAAALDSGFRYEGDPPFGEGDAPLALARLEEARAGVSRLRWEERKREIDAPAGTVRIEGRVLGAGPWGTFAESLRATLRFGDALRLGGAELRR